MFLDLPYSCPKCNSKVSVMGAMQIILAMKGNFQGFRCLLSISTGGRKPEDEAQALFYVAEELLLSALPGHQGSTPEAPGRTS